MLIDRNRIVLIYLVVLIMRAVGWVRSDVIARCSQVMVRILIVIINGKIESHRHYQIIGDKFSNPILSFLGNEVSSQTLNFNLLMLIENYKPWTPSGLEADIKFPALISRIVI